MKKIFYFIAVLAIVCAASCGLNHNCEVVAMTEIENTNSSEYYYHIIELFEVQDIPSLTLKQVIEFAKNNRPTNLELIENLQEKGPYSILFNGKEDFDTVIYGIRYKSNKVI